MADVFNEVKVKTRADGDVVVGFAAGVSTAVTGSVTLGAGAASIGTVVLGTGSADVGSVAIQAGQTIGIAAGAASIGTVGIDAGTASIGTVGLNTGTNSIGTVGIDAGTASIGTVGLNTGTNSVGTVGLDTGTNSVGTVGLNTGTNSVGTVGLDAGSNIIGKVQVVGTTGTVFNELVTSGVILKNAGTETLVSSVITNTKTGELKSITITSSVAMKALIRKHNTITPVPVDVVILPAGGGTVVRDFPDDSILQAGTANGEYFDVILTNLDTKDATGYVTFYYTEE